VQINATAKQLRKAEKTVARAKDKLKRTDFDKQSLVAQIGHLQGLL
jgi:hypothetical protein